MSVSILAVTGNYSEHQMGRPYGFSFFWWFYYL